jgi:hypothetical protein
MRADVKIRIETRDEGRCCSFRCPYFGNVENGGRGLEFSCQLFNVILLVGVGSHAPTRSPQCVQLELVPERVKPKKPKADTPTIWDHLLKG